MADQTIPQTPDDDEVLKKRLVGRMALAAVLIVALLGGLALFDALNAPEKPAAPAPVAAVPPAPEPKPAEAARPEEKAEAKAEDEAKEAPAAEPERTESAGAPALRGPRPGPSRRSPRSTAAGRPSRA